MKAITRVSSIDGGSFETAMIWCRGVWAVTRAVAVGGAPYPADPPTHCWVVTHLPTGRSVTNRSHGPENAARQLANDLFEHFPTWEAGAEFGSTPEVPEYLKALVLFAVSQ